MLEIQFSCAWCGMTKIKSYHYLAQIPGNTDILITSDGFQWVGIKEDEDGPWLHILLCDSCVKERMQGP
jgi:hypothetical protein